MGTAIVTVPRALALMSAIVCTLGIAWVVGPGIGLAATAGAAAIAAGVISRRRVLARGRKRRPFAGLSLPS